METRERRRMVRGVVSGMGGFSIVDCRLSTVRFHRGGAESAESFRDVPNLHDSTCESVQRVRLEASARSAPTLSRSIPAGEGRTFAGMKVLRLGNSNDTTASVPEELKSPAVANAILAAASGEPVELVTRMMWPSEQIPGLVEKWLRTIGVFR